MRVDRGPARVISYALVVMSWSTTAWAQAAPANAQPESGSRWLAKCAAPAHAEPPADNQGVEKEVCLGWVTGLLDLNEIYRGLGALERTSEGFCVPADATLEQAARAVVQYLKDHPSDLHVSARMLAYMALRQAFPCPRL